MVRIDAPPVFEQADALASGSQVPHAVLVVESENTPYEALDRRRHAVAAGDISIVAAVLTKQPRIIPEWFYRWLVQ